MPKRYSKNSRTTKWRKRRKFEKHWSSGQQCQCDTCMEAVRLQLYTRKDDSTSSAETSSDSDEIENNELLQSAAFHCTDEERVEIPENSVFSNQEFSTASDTVIQVRHCIIQNGGAETAKDSSSASRGILISEESSEEPSGGGSQSSSRTSSDTSSHSSHNDDGGGDGDDPSSGDDSSSDSGTSGNSSEDNFNVNHEQLNDELVMLQHSTARDAIALYLAIAARYGLPYEAVIAMMNGQNTLLGVNTLPKDTRGLWKILGRSSSGITMIPYCKLCLSELDVNVDLIQCEACNNQLALKDVKYFVHVSFEKQLKLFLQTPGTSDLMKYRENRDKTGLNTIEDIFDGAAFKQLLQNGVLSSEHDFTYTFNTDGFRISKKGTLEAWPLFLRLNEIKPTLRQKCIFLAGLWVDETKPNFNIFLKPFITEANKLSSEGISWERDGLEVNSKFIPTCLCSDAKARAPVLNMKDVTGYHGCTFCTHPGVFFGRMKVKFPIQPNPPAFDFEPPLLRTHQGMLNDIQEAMDLPNVDDDVNGHKGPTILMTLDHFDLAVNQVTDDLHPLYEGATKTHLQMFLKKERPYSLSPRNIKIVNRRLRSVKTPTHVSRKPRIRIDKSKKWNGSEYRNWLLHYSIPCMNGLLPRRYLDHWALLANAAFLLHKTVITEEDLQDADRCIQLYLEQYQFFFGPENMRFNFHVLKHLVQCVRNWGPMWTQTTFHFESWNFRLLRYVKSAHTAKDQIITRFLLHSMAERLSLDNAISPHVRQYIQKLMGKKVHTRVVAVADAYFLGTDRIRNPTVAEQEALQECGIFYDSLHYFDRVLYQSKEFRCLSYHPQSKSNNTFIYLRDDTFCQIQSVVFIEDVMGNRHSGVFVKRCHVLHSAPNAGYMVSVEVTQDIKFATLNEIVCLCVKVDAAGDTFLSPIPNQHEID